MLYHSSLELIGRTPLVELSRIPIPNNNRIFAKLEGVNPAGGVKDRVALHILSKLRDEGKLTQDSIIIEATAGNTGLGIAFVALHFGVRARLIVPDKFSIEKQVLMRALGAEVINTPKSEGMQGAIALARQMIESNPNAISINQFENLENPRAHYLSTAREIWEDLRAGHSALTERHSACDDFLASASSASLRRMSNTPHSQSLHSPKNSSAILECQGESFQKDSKNTSESTFSESRSVAESTPSDSHRISDSIYSDSRVADSKPTSESALPVIESEQKLARQSIKTEYGLESHKAKQDSKTTDCRDFAPTKSRNDAKADSHPHANAQSTIALDSKNIESPSPLLHYFIAGAGSGGSFSGIARFLKEQDSRIQAVLCDPVGSIIGGGEEGCANIEGIGNSFIPATMDTRLIDKVIKIADEEAYAGVRLLASKEGILAGISSGACLQACLKLAEEVSDSIIVTLFADDFSRYFSRNLI